MYFRGPKRSKFKLNLMLTISLDPEFPVVDFDIREENWNSDMFTQYIANRKLLDLVKYDLIDRVSFHKLSYISKTKHEMSIEDAYKIHEVEVDYIPTGYPKFNAVEQTFNYLKTYVKSKRHELNITGNWSKTI